MFGKPKGYIGINPEITHSKTPGMSPLGDYDMTKDYFEALQGKMVQIIDIAVDGSSFLVYGEGKLSGGFLWNIDKEDTSQQIIPYKFLHPGTDIHDIIETLKIIGKGDPEAVPCVNFLNQPAIDAVIREHNKDMGEDFYTEGRNVCFECRGEKLMMMGDIGTYRICFKAREPSIP